MQRQTISGLIHSRILALAPRPAEVHTPARRAPNMLPMSMPPTPPKPQVSVGAVLDVLCGALLAALLVQLLANGFFPDRRMWQYAAQAYSHWAQIVAYPLLAYALARKLRGRALAAAILCLAQLASLPTTYAGVWGRRSPPTVGPSLRLVSSNVMFNHRDPARLAAEFESINAPLVLIQEHGPAWFRAFDQRHWTERYPFSQRLLHASPAFGIAVYSRYPVRFLPPIMTGPIKQLPFMVRLGDQNVLVLNLHMPGAQRSTSAYQAGQRDLLRWLDARDPSVPLVVVGDFNMTPQHRFYQDLAQRLSDGWLDAGFGLGLSFPNGHTWKIPPVRLDYIWTSPKVAVREIQLTRNIGSDHAGLLAEIAVVSGNTRQ